MAGVRTLAEAYRRFGSGVGRESALYAGVAAAVAASPEALRAIETAPARRRQPAPILAALHDLALAGRAPALAAAYARGDVHAAGEAAIDALARMPGEVAAGAARRAPLPDEAGRHAVLYPAIAEAAHRAGASRVALIDVGRAAGLNLCVDRVAVAYDDGRSLGDPSSSVRVSCAIAAGSVPGARAGAGAEPGLGAGAEPGPEGAGLGPVGKAAEAVPGRQSAGAEPGRQRAEVGRELRVGGSVPGRAVPEVVGRVVVHPEPVDVTDAGAARWLRACVPPDQRERGALLEAEIALAAASPPVRHAGDPVEALPEVLAQAPADALPIVITTWALSRLPPESRPSFLRAIDRAAVTRPLAWVSAEGVGVAPAIPTLGDRHASGHSIIGVGVFEGPRVRVEAVGRCWSQGRIVSWLASAGRER